MLQDFFNTSMKIYLPIFIGLFVVTYYLATMFVADDAFLEAALSDASSNAHSANTFFFSYTGLRTLISWTTKTVLIAAGCFLVSGISFTKFLQIGLLSMFAYVLSFLVKFIDHILFPPTSILELRRNALSLWSTGRFDEQSMFIQNLSWHTNPFELLYLFLFLYGTQIAMKQHHTRTNKWLVYGMVLGVEIAYILVTAWW